MNPGVVHTCNPIKDEPWSYLMLFVDLPWLQAQGFELPLATYSTSPVLYGRLLEVFATLFDDQCADRQACLAAFFRTLRVTSTTSRHRRYSSIPGWKLLLRSSALIGSTL